MEIPYNVLQDVINVTVPIITSLGAYYAKKAQKTETDLAVFKGEAIAALAALTSQVNRDRENGERRHGETLAVMKEMREDVREVRREVGELIRRA